MNSPVEFQVSAAIPTYGRENVLIETIEALRGLEFPPAEILVVDQTPRHSDPVEEKLKDLHAKGGIRWIRLERPSIPAAMNHALAEAKSPVVLFVDDDVLPGRGLVEAHGRNYADPAVWAVTGQVLQPGQEPTDLPYRSRKDGIRKDLDFPFTSTGRRTLSNCMAGNLSVRRERALAAGGFDENFVGDAYRFETDFCRRLIAAGGVMVFDPAASLRHLQAQEGGVRSRGSHLRGLSPEYTMGEYYFALRQSSGFERLSFILYRLLRSVRTRYHLSRPWRIPRRIGVELRGLALAVSRYRVGPSFPGEVQ